MSMTYADNFYDSKVDELMVKNSSRYGDLDTQMLDIDMAAAKDDELNRLWKLKNDLEEREEKLKQVVTEMSEAVLYGPTCDCWWYSRKLISFQRSCIKALAEIYPKINTIKETI